MPHRRLPVLLAAAALAAGLGGCQHLTRLSQWAHERLAGTHRVKITPAPLLADAPRPDPNAAENSLYARAVAAIDQRNYGFALDVLQLAREARPNDPRVLSAMGVVYDKLGRFDLSARYYDLAETADPGSKVVAIDRSYSRILQQRSLAPRPAETIVLAQAHVVRLTQDGRIAAPDAAPSQPLLIGGPIRVRNATGAPNGADPVVARLADLGWRITRAPAAGRGSTSRLQFPPKAERVAEGLARSLPFKIQLDPCQGCARVELVVGADAVAGMKVRGA